MTWVVVGCLVLGLGFGWAALLMNMSGDADSRSAAPLYMLPGIVLIGAAVVLAIGNAAVKALL